MRKGFTVIEVIVTFVILSILIFFAIYSFRYSIANIQRATYYLPQKAAAFDMLDRTIGGIYYYAVEKNEEKEKENFENYFRANATQMVFITVAPPYTEEISIAKLALEKKRLILSYAPLYQNEVDFLKPKLPQTTTKVILFEQVEAFDLSYILPNKEHISQTSGTIPTGVIMHITIRGEKYHMIFSISSNYNGSKAREYHEKYPM